MVRREHRKLGSRGAGGQMREETAITCEQADSSESNEPMHADQRNGQHEAFPESFPA